MSLEHILIYILMGLAGILLLVMIYFFFFLDSKRMEKPKGWWKPRAGIRHGRGWGQRFDTPGHDHPKDEQQESSEK